MIQPRTRLVFACALALVAALAAAAPQIFVADAPIHFVGVRLQLADNQTAEVPLIQLDMQPQQILEWRRNAAILNQTRYLLARTVQFYDALEMLARTNTTDRAAANAALAAAVPSAVLNFCPLELLDPLTNASIPAFPLNMSGLAGVTAAAVAQFADCAVDTVLFPGLMRTHVCCAQSLDRYRHTVGAGFHVIHALQHLHDLRSGLATANTTETQLLAAATALTTALQRLVNALHVRTTSFYTELTASTAPELPLPPLFCFESGAIGMGHAGFAGLDRPLRAAVVPEPERLQAAARNASRTVAATRAFELALVTGDARAQEIAFGPRAGHGIRIGTPALVHHVRPCMLSFGAARRAPLLLQSQAAVTTNRAPALVWLNTSTSAIHCAAGEGVAALRVHVALRGEVPARAQNAHITLCGHAQCVVSMACPGVLPLNATASTSGTASFQSLELAAYVASNLL